MRTNVLQSVAAGWVQASGGVASQVQHALYDAYGPREYADAEA